MNKHKIFYETQSLPLAVSIICCGTNLYSVIKSPDGKSTFVFEKTPELTKTIEFFWQRALKIEPNSFWESLRFLKSRIYGG